VPRARRPVIEDHEEEREVLAKRLVVALLLSSLVTGAAAETRILFNSFFPPQHFLTRDVMRGWAKDVERVTEGRVRVSIPASSAAPPPRLWDAVSSGIVDGAYMFNGHIENRIHLPLVAQLPWSGTGSAERVGVALWRTYKKHMEAADEYKGVQLIGLFAAPGGELYSMTDRPIASIEHLKARKMWALPGTTAQVMQNLGISIVAGPAVRMHEIISAGVVEGFIGIPLIDADGFKSLNYAKSITTFPASITVPTFAMFIRADKWAELSEADRRAVMSVSGEALARRVGAAFDRHNAEVRKRLERDGVPFVDASPEFYAAMRQAGEPLVAAWKEKARSLGFDAEAVLSFYRAQLEQAERK